MKKTSSHSAAIVRHAIQNLNNNKEGIMCTSLHEELGFTLFGRKPERSTASENNVCKKCGATLWGALTGRQRSVNESNEVNSEFNFTVVSYCRYCDKKPGSP